MMKKPLFAKADPIPPIGIEMLRGTTIRPALLALYVIENNGTRHIAAMLRTNGVKVLEIYFKDWVNNYFQPPLELEVENLIRLLQEHKINLVGISVRASAYHDLASQLTWRIRRELGIPVLWGGMHSTFVPEDCIPVADVVCVGEAELPLLELLRRLEAGEQYLDTASFWFTSAGRVVANPTRPLLSDLDSLPFRDFHSQDKYFISGARVKQGDPYVRDPVFLMSASRGCPYSTCAYCSNTVLTQTYQGKGSYYRQRSVDSVIEELHYAKRTFPNLKRIRFDDEVFAFDREWTERFVTRYKNEIGLPFDCLLDPRSVATWRLEKLKAAGLDLLCIGIQNCERINRAVYNRHISERQVLQAAEIVNRLRIRVSYQIILDDPLANAQDKWDFYMFLLQLPRPYDFYLFSITYYPRTKLTERLLRDGVITPEQVEGKAKKVFEQFRVDLGYRRAKEDTFWAALIILLSKDFIPKSILRQAAANQWLKRHPLPLVILAQITNLYKMGALFGRMLVRGEVNLTLVKRWLNLRSLITT